MSFRRARLQLGSSFSVVSLMACRAKASNSEFARQYFRVFGEERVKFGMTKEEFVACD
jgi:hypothetical protein